MKDVIVERFQPDKKIVYPAAEQAGSGNKDPAELMPDDHNFNTPLHYKGFQVHHIETLQPHIYYLRGLVDHTTAHRGTIIDRYVFSARINMRTFTKEDFKVLIDDVIEHIKMADNLNHPTKEA